MSIPFKERVTELLLICLSPVFRFLLSRYMENLSVQNCIARQVQIGYGLKKKQWRYHIFGW